MKWYPNLYMGERAKEKQKKIIRKLKLNAGQMDVYLITFAANGKDIFDIVSSVWLKQRWVRRNLPMIVGIACGYGEAVELTVQIVEEAYRNTGSVQVKKYLTEQARKKRI